jgi:hypothetical protein
MKIFIICSKKFYGEIPSIQKTLEKAGHIITLPNCHDDPSTEQRYKDLGDEEHGKWKSRMMHHSCDVIEDMDAVLVINFEKNGVQNHIGGATFLEMCFAFRLHKKIFLYNPIPDGILRDEIVGFCPIVINSDLSLVE